MTAHRDPPRWEIYDQMVLRGHSRSLGLSSLPRTPLGPHVCYVAPFSFATNRLLLLDPSAGGGLAWGLELCVSLLVFSEGVDGWTEA